MNNFLYALPFGRSKLLGGWQLNGLFDMQSGNWLTPVYSGADPSNTNNLAGRPDVLGTPNNPHTVNAWFDTSAFAVPAANSGRFGNAGRGIIQGPGWILANLGLQKSVKTERFGSFQVVASFQNVINHRNLGDPVAAGDTSGTSTGNIVIANANAGKITSTTAFPVAGSPRTGMLGFRWSF